MKATTNRETYLTEIAQTFLVPHFQDAGYDLASIINNCRFSCSLTSGTRASSKNQTIGLCWSKLSSENGYSEIMISPTIADTSRAIDILIHEIVHALIGHENGHNSKFKKCAVAVGLTGKMTATIASDELKEKIKEWIKIVGEYPHAKLNLTAAKKQTTRMIKCKCSKCDFTMYTSRRTLRNVLIILAIIIPLQLGKGRSV